MATQNESPEGKKVEAFHRNADKDKRAESLHHTLGNGRTQAANGAHNHRDGNGAPILDGTVFTGSRSANTVDVLRQVLDALESLGATDSTVA